MNNHFCNCKPSQCDEDSAMQTILVDILRVLKCLVSTLSQITIAWLDAKIF